MPGNYALSRESRAIINFVSRSVWFPTHMEQRFSVVSMATTFVRVARWDSRDRWVESWNILTITYFVSRIVPGASRSLLGELTTLRPSCLTKHNPVLQPVSGLQDTRMLPVRVYLDYDGENAIFILHIYVYYLDFFPSFRQNVEWKQNKCVQIFILHSQVQNIANK